MSMPSLPNEILLIIFDYATNVVPVHEKSVLRWERISYIDTLDLVRASNSVKKAIMLTCKRWHDVVHPSLHEWIVLKQKRSLLSFVAHIRQLSTMPPSYSSPLALTRRLDLNLDHLPDNYDTLLAFIIRSLPHLVELNFAMSALSYIDYPLNVPVCQALKARPSLRVLNWYTEILLPMPRAWHDILVALPRLEVTTCVHSLRTWPYNDNPPMPVLPHLHTLLISSHCNGCLSTAPCVLPALRTLAYYDRSLSFSRSRFRADQTWRNSSYFEEHGGHIQDLYLDSDEDEHFMDHVVAHCSRADTLHITVRIPGPILARPFPESVRRLRICNRFAEDGKGSVAKALNQILMVLLDRPGQHGLRTIELAHVRMDAQSKLLPCEVYNTRSSSTMRDVELVDAAGRVIL
ncbi:hypothetical protein EV122DRAFT_286247 [Schizophyllum commune]